MNLMVLILGKPEREAIKKLKDYAEAHPLSLEDIKASMDKLKKPVGDIPEFVMFLPIGIRVVYSIENQKLGPARHISISVDRFGKLPNLSVVNEILKEFGFNAQLETYTVGAKFTVWLEKEVNAINVLELV